MPRRRPRAVRHRAHDAGYAGVIYLMEAIVGGLVIFGAFLYVSTDAQRAGIDNADADPVIWENYKSDAYQILVTLKETDVNRGFVLLPEAMLDRFEGGPLLPALLSDQDGSEAEAWVERKLPAGSESNLRVCRAKACHAVYEDDADRAARGTVAAAGSPTFLDFEYSLVRPLLDHVSVDGDLPLGGVPADRGRVVRSQLQIDLIIDTLDGDMYEHTRAGIAPTDSGGATLAFEGLTLARSIRLHESPNAMMAFELVDEAPFSARIQWNIPAGWGFVDVEDAIGWEWSPVDAVEGHPFTVTVSRDPDVTPGAADRILRFTLTPPSTPSRSYDIFPVTYSGGLRGYQELVVTYPTAPSVTTPRRVLLSVPDPLPTGETGLLGIVVASGAESTTVESLHVDAREGTDVFVSAAGWDASLPAGTVALDGDRGGFTFTPNTAVVVPAGATREFKFRIEADPAALRGGEPAAQRRHDDREPPAIGFPGSAYSPTVYRSRNHAGVYVVDVPPATVAAPGAWPAPDGYPHSFAPAATETWEVRATSGDGRFAKTATAEYHVSLLDPATIMGYRAALDLSTLRTEPEAAALDGAAVDVTVRADWSALLSTLGEQGLATLRDTLRVYAPASLGLSPTAEFSATEASGARHEILTAAWGDVAGDAAEDLILAAEDGNVYVLSALGAELSTVVGSGVETERPVDAFPVAGRRLFVAYANGTVALRDPVTGAMDYQALGLDSLVDAAAELTGEARAAVVGRAGTEERACLVAIPALTSSCAALPLAATRVAVADTPGRGAEATVAVALVDHSVVVLDDSLAQIGAVPPQIASAKALWVGDAGGPVRDVRVGYFSSVVAWDGETGAVSGGGTLAEAPSAFVPDLDGDGVRDLASAGPVTLAVVSGADGEALWEVEYPTGAPPDPECPLVEDHPVIVIQDCEPSGSDLPRGGVSVAGDGERVFVAYRGVDDGVVLAVIEDGTWTWDPVALGPAVHAPLAAHPTLLAAGLADGAVRVWTNPGGAEVWTEAVTDLTGTFSYRIRVPAGTLLGDHVLESELAWEEADLADEIFTQRARQLSILTVEDARMPDVDPLYYLVLDAWGGDWRTKDS